MFGNVGMGELLVIFLVTLLVFGAKRIPEIARGLGQGLREFRSATREIARELDLDDLSRPAPRPQSRPVSSGSPAGNPPPPPSAPAEQAPPLAPEIPLDRSAGQVA